MKITLLKDILKTKAEDGLRYSQGRIYLFVFVLCYLAVLGYYTFKPTDLQASIQTIIDSLQWGILLFAAYAFGTKSVEATKNIVSTIKGNSPLANVTSTQSAPQQPAQPAAQQPAQPGDMPPSNDIAVL
jgi:hypothetical protein